MAYSPDSLTLPAAETIKYTHDSFYGERKNWIKIINTPGVMVDLFSGEFSEFVESWKKYSNYIDNSDPNNLEQQKLDSLWMDMVGEVGDLFHYIHDVIAVLFPEFGNSFVSSIVDLIISDGQETNVEDLLGAISKQIETLSTRVEQNLFGQLVNLYNMLIRLAKAIDVNPDYAVRLKSERNREKYPKPNRAVARLFSVLPSPVAEKLIWRMMRQQKRKWNAQGGDAVFFEKEVANGYGIEKSRLSIALGSLNNASK